MTKLIAIDPGYDRCGVAILLFEAGITKLETSLCVTTKKTDPHEKRLQVIFDAVQSVILEHKPDYLALEGLFFSVNKKTALKVAEARGVLSLLAAQHAVPLVEVSPQQVKLAMTGVGNATKEQVQRMAKLLLKIDTTAKIDDEIDAIAVGIAAAEEIRLGKLFSQK